MNPECCHGGTGWLRCSISNHPSVAYRTPLAKGATGPMQAFGRLPCLRPNEAGCPPRLALSVLGRGTIECSTNQSGTICDRRPERCFSLGRELASTEIKQ